MVGVRPHHICDAIAASATPYFGIIAARRTPTLSHPVSDISSPPPPAIFNPIGFLRTTGFYGYAALPVPLLFHSSGVPALLPVCSLGRGGGGDTYWRRDRLGYLGLLSGPQGSCGHPSVVPPPLLASL